ncbi:hypothetical protein T01_12987 [Trichinella spiralis]|uniref:Uncharacterized protein n=1 Tax=Trichinella spiralis TaxID=6334 RepID=A0A0V1B394_TRISP|nr:hypothetical protein T01_12987 [Trichinella spiralis]
MTCGAIRRNRRVKLRQETMEWHFNKINWQWRRLHVRTPLMVDVSLWVPLMSCAHLLTRRLAKVNVHCGQSWKNEVEFNDEKSHSFSRDRYNFKL